MARAGGAVAGLFLLLFVPLGGQVDSRYLITMGAVLMFCALLIVFVGEGDGEDGE